MSVLARPEVVFVAGRWVERRACSYCWATFIQARTNQYTCSPECAKRDSAWESWIASTRRDAVHGRPGRAAPNAGASLAASVARFEVRQLDLPISA